MESQDRPWSDLPTDILNLILPRIPCAHYPHFALVCKNWSRIPPRVHPGNRTPLLLTHHETAQGHGGVFHYYSPSADRTFLTGRHFDISGYKFYYAESQWLLFCKKRKCLFVDPLCGRMHLVEGPRNGTRFTGYVFLGSPPRDFLIVAIDGSSDTSVVICVYFHLQWAVRMSCRNNLPFRMSRTSNPLFVSGIIYCLGDTGDLGIFDPGQFKWSVRRIAGAFDASCRESYLTRSKDELYVAQVGIRGTSRVQVLRLDQERGAWEIVESLGARSLFIGQKMSVMATQSDSRLRNKVFVPKFRGGQQPEPVDATLKTSNGRLFFEFKGPHCAAQSEEAERSDEPSICCYSLDRIEQPELFGPAEGMAGIWFDMRWNRKS